MAAQTVADVMTLDVTTASTADTARDAAKLMRERHVGDVLVVEADQLAGIVTDRDLVIRVLADGLDPDQARVGEICSSDVLEVRPETTADDALIIMREAAVRRLPVVDSGRLVGIVSLGDFAAESDGDSVLSDISLAEPNL
ncbi:CBS domain-containing protein [Flindersiella endophytica]